MRIAILFIAVFTAFAVFTTHIFADEAKLLWRIDGCSALEPPKFNFSLAQPPTRQNGKTTVCTPDGKLIGIDDTTGKRIWEYPWNLPSEIQIEILAPKPRSIFRAPRFPPDPGPGLRRASFALANDGDIVLFCDGKEMTLMTWSWEGKHEWSQYLREPDGPKHGQTAALGAPLIIKKRGYALEEFEYKYYLITFDIELGIRSRWKRDLAKDAPRVEDPVIILHTHAFKIGDEQDIKYARESPYKSVAYSPVQCGKLVICPLPDGDLAAYDIKTNKVLWRTKVDDDLYAPFRLLATDNRVLLFFKKQCLCLDAKNGDVVWKQEKLDDFPCVLWDGKIAISEAGVIRAVVVATGENAWTQKLPAGATVVANGDIHEGRLLLPMSNHEFQPFDLKTGALDEAIAIPDHQVERVGGKSRIQIGHLFSRGDAVYSLSIHDIIKFELAR